MQPLDPLALPLHGCRLIEASAGTGKTYTLALLFLRLVLERGLTVDQILVVTFTRAATGELRDRIRARLRHALDCLEGRATPDPQLARLLASTPREAGRQRLNDGLVRMDEAAIHTIHGFCQRILQDHAFESGLPFDLELLESETALRQQVSEDFWRRRFYPAGEEVAAWALATWGDPAGLLKALGASLTAWPCDLVPPVDTAQIESLTARSEELFTEMRQAWSRDRDAVAAVLEEDPCLLRNQKAYHCTGRVPQLLAAMDQLAARETMPWLLPPHIGLLAASTMAGLVRKKKTCTAPPDHPFFILFDGFFHSHEHCLRWRTIQILEEARRFLDKESARRKRDQGWLAFDDLLTRLATALNQAASGQHLAGRIRARYPVALVDEFQDTDPIQYQVFSRIYGQDNGTLLMIGDPKQAIYSFRGADIFTYIQARRATDAAHRATLTTNYRSTPAMVRAVNTLFDNRPDAFIFSEDIPFQPVQAAGESSAVPLLLDGRELAPLSAFLLDSERLRSNRSATISKDSARQAAVVGCADSIVRLLEAAAQGRATLAGNALQAADIAILVRTHREAEAIQAGLRQRGLASVASSQDSVFATDEARQLSLVLAALIELNDAPCVRTALATDLFGCDAATIHALTCDEQPWELRLASLHRMRELWRDQGFMPMFQHLLAEERVTLRLTARPGGERSLTNYLHLAELLQQSPAAHHGMAALLRWFRQQIAHPDANAAEQLIRLENDEQLIRIVTIHRAKGLEYPVVYLPFLWAGRPLGKNQTFSFHDRTTLRLTLDLGSGREEYRRWAEEEQLAEELRLLYVALTRARSCCLFCWGRVNGLDQTGLAHLLHQGHCPQSDAELIAGLEQLNARATIIELHRLPETFPRHRFDSSSGPPQLEPRLFRGRIAPGWTMTSYSRLSGGSDHGPDEEGGERETALPSAAEEYASPMTFPRGPAAGTCVHTLLERLDCHRPAHQQRLVVAEVLEQHGIDPRWLTATVTWLDDLLAVELPGACALGRLPARDLVKELGFLFPLEQLDLRRFNALLAEAGFRPLAVAAPMLQGLMKGFIDLVFRHQGRYNIVDYKSNHLGPSLADYGPEALTGCMDSHQYHLQSLIYTLALHRLLRFRFPGYRYDAHIGAVYYLFVRAMHPAHPPGYGIHVSRPDWALIDALDHCCRGGYGP